MHCLLNLLQFNDSLIQYFCWFLDSFDFNHSLKQASTYLLIQDSSKFLMYSGKWAGCSHTCGEGVQTRPVLCIQEDPELRNKTVIRSSLTTTEPGTMSKIVNVDLCQDRRRPRESRKCRIQACKPTWFTTPWSKVILEVG